jgi:hypothetical protein
VSRVRPLLALVAVSLLVPAAAAQARVLRVGTFHGHRGSYRTIQRAVDAAHPGDVVLVAPGVYHERGDYKGPHASGGGDEAGAGVMITTPGITLRGLDRNKVIVDGTKPSDDRACSSSPGRQDFGPAGADGRALGRNGIEVFKTDDVTIENLTVCNFLDGAGGGGNQVWFNNGDGSGVSGPNPFHGAYLSATSSFYGGPGAPAGSYGIFVSNSSGPGTIEHTYASNQDDSSYYVGACTDCNTVVTDAHAQYSALGYSGTNSGGHLRIEHSEWDHNKTGIVTNSQNNDDAPSPQQGWCPGSTTTSCTFFQDNDIHDNNNPNVPGAGSAALGPVGTGLVIAGGRGDTVRGNTIHDNGAWGVLTVPFPDSETPPPISHCDGGTPNVLGFPCYYDDFGNEVTGNTFAHNGFFGNATNGDLGDISGQNTPGNCWHGNTDAAGVTSAPTDLQATHGTCGVPNAGASLADPLSAQVICDTQLLGPCTTSNYPRTTQVVMPPLERQRQMPDPCSGVPADPWCRRHGGSGHHEHGGGHQEGDD